MGERSRGQASDADIRLLNAATAMIGSGLPGGAPVTRMQLDLLCTARPMDERYPHAQMRLISAARMLALVRLERRAEALEDAEAMSAYGSVPQDRELPFDVAMATLAARAEAHFFGGDTARSLRYATWLSDYTEGSASRWRHRALGLPVASYAGTGDHDRAEEALVELRSIATAHGWGPEHGDYMALIGEGIVALTRFDAARSARLQSEARALAVRQRRVAPLADLFQSQSHMLSGELHEAIALTARIAQGAPQPKGSERVRGHALNLQALSLVLDGEPVRALGVLSGLDSSRHHLVCHAGPRAVARLHLGEYRDVLSGTSECVKQRTDHNLWTLQLVLLCRSVAQARLDMPRAAVRNAVEAFMLARNVDLSQAFSLFPPTDLVRLFDLVDSRIPERIENVARLRTLLARSGGSSGAPSLPRLTPRQAEVARHLRGEATLREIAAELHLAESTVKTHVKAIYRELGASGRQEAVVRLERIGFYEV